MNSKKKDKKVKQPKQKKEMNKVMNKTSFLNETQMIAMRKQLELFRENMDETELILPNIFDNKQRLTIHQLCRQLDLKSKSHGNGNGKQYTVASCNVLIRQLNF